MAGPGDAGTEDDRCPVGDGELVVAGGQSPPLLEQGERSFDEIALFVEGFVEGGGLPPADPRRLRAAISSRFCGMTAVILRLRSMRRVTPLV